MKNLLKLFITFSLFILASRVMAGNEIALKFDVNKYETSITSFDGIELPDAFEYLKFNVNDWMVPNEDGKPCKHEKSCKMKKENHKSYCKKMKSKGFPEVKRKK